MESGYRSYLARTGGKKGNLSRFVDRTMHRFEYGLNVFSKLSLLGLLRLLGVEAPVRARRRAA